MCLFSTEFSSSTVGIRIIWHYFHFITRLLLLQMERFEYKNTRSDSNSIKNTTVLLDRFRTVMVKLFFSPFCLILIEWFSDLVNMVLGLQTIDDRYMKS